MRDKNPTRENIGLEGYKFFGRVHGKSNPRDVFSQAITQQSILEPVDINLLLATKLGINPSIVEEQLIKEKFVNPATDNPVRIQDFLKHLDLSEIVSVLNDMYAEEYRFKYSPEAVLKTMIYFKLRHRFLSEVFDDLITDPDLATDLGFNMIPNYKQLYHFLNYRVGGKGTQNLSDAFVKAILSIYPKLGERLVIDATPLEAKPTDKDAEYNGHYKMKGYLWHGLRCLDTSIPIAWHVSHANEDEGTFLAPLLMKARQLGIKFEKVYSDCGYASLENIMRVHEFFGADFRFNLAKDWVIRKDGTIKAMKKRYQKFWLERMPFWEPNASFEHMKRFLIMVGRSKMIGAYYRNSALKEYEECPDGYLDDYHLRNRIEGNHGTEKRQTELKNFNGKGINKFTAHVGMHVIALQAIALCRLQNGISERLINLGGLT